MTIESQTQPHEGTRCSAEQAIERSAVLKMRISAFIIVPLFYKKLHRKTFSFREGETLLDFIVRNMNGKNGAAYVLICLFLCYAKFLVYNVWLIKLL